MLKEKQIFIDFLKKKGQKFTSQREAILSTFLKTEKHLSIEDLYRVIKNNHSDIGQATVFRTLKLLAQAKIAREIYLGDKRVRFEHNYGHKHHDHLVCLECSELIEAVDLKIEKLQEQLCRKFNFQPISHRLQIFGLCQKCFKKRDKRK